jgi:hypothetical protein
MLVRSRAALRALILLTCLLATPGFGAEAKYSAWDQFFYKVQLPVKAAAPASEVTLLVYHSYPAPLHEVGATGKSASLTVTRQPADLKKLDPTEIVSFTFAVRRTGAADRKQVPLTVTLRAKELPGAKPIEVMIPLTAGAEQELWQQQAVPVGTMEVRIGGWGNQMYFLYLLPMLALLAWMLWRRQRLGRL